MKRKYKLTIFKDRFKTTGVLTEKTFEEIFFAFRDKVRRTRDKYREYMNADRETKNRIKDVGGFIGGETEGNRRTTGIRIMRQILTLDIDTKLPNILDYLKRNVYFLCIVHSTHSHSPNENRFRLIAPLSREVNADEYEAVGRRVAYQIENSKYETLQGLFDETTFQANRLMFFPSVSADGEYICELLNLNVFDDEQPIIDVDKILDDYLDYKDVYEWFKPQKTDSYQIGKNALCNKQPLKAKGLVGAFNRTYTVSQAIEKFLPQVYRKEKNGRYTYLKGESYGGGVLLNNDTIFYSHHGTDPANTYYRSAFDLVRIHRFGSYDTDFTPERLLTETVWEKSDSFQKMIEFCRSLPEVVANSEANIALSQRLEQEAQAIAANYPTEPTSTETPQDGDATTNGSSEEEEKEEDKWWIVKLDGVKNPALKLSIIFEHDKILKGLFYYDTFRDNICFLRQPYWRKEFVPGTAIDDRDMSHIRHYLKKVYDVSGKDVVDDAIVVEADKIQINKVKDFFESLVWDGKPRLETFFHDFFKVPLNPFTRVAFKHWLVGAVSRVYKAGAPMDLVLVIKGNQGIGKSLFLKRLATFDFSKPEDHLYSDTKIDFNKAKDSYEQLEGIWIYEWKELAGMNMSEQESIKAFVDKTEDKFRRSYGRRITEIKRRVAFAGTTNDKTPLRDRTGNRRFLVLESQLERHECYIKDMSLFSQEYRDQLIAEAIHLYKNGFDIFAWSREELDWWEKSNEANLAENDFQGAISNYLNMRRPRSWYSMSIMEMLNYMNTYDFEKDRSTSQLYDNAALVPVERVCVLELWKIALQQRDPTINRYHRELILQAIENLGWEIDRTRQSRFGPFGHQQPITRKRQKQSALDLPF